MTDARLRVIDADGHVTGPPTVWTGYVEEAYRGRAPRPALDEPGQPCQVMGGQMAMRDAMLLTLGPERSFAGYKARAGGFDPNARLADLDSEGIAIAVLPVDRALLQRRARRRPPGRALPRVQP